MNFRRTLTATALLLLSFSASAETITFNNITASWINIDPGSIVASGNGTTSTSMRWGEPATDAGQSGYDFDAAVTPFGIDVNPGDLSDLFTLGLFTHLNNPIFAPSLSSATLEVVVDIVGIGNLTFLFDFFHDETPNGDDPCAYGGDNGQGANINGCADSVTIGFNELSDTFEIDGLDYTLAISGFNTGRCSDDSGLVDNFLTVEEQDNSASICAQLALAERVQVPEPGTLALLGLGLLGMGLARRRVLS